MGFGEGYLQKAALRNKLIGQPPRENTAVIVTIPVYKEARLDRCLDSLYSCTRPAQHRPSFHCEVLILINAAADDREEVLSLNQSCLLETREWIRAHPHPFIDFHLWLDHGFGKKEAGVGSARKILMDEAVRRFDQIGQPRGLIVSLDADSVVDQNYLQALHQHFFGEEGSKTEGCSIYFEHPLQAAGDPFGEDLPPEIYLAIARYELHLRYYLWSLRSTGFPHAYHTLGSAFAVRAEVYALEGGMNRRQGGEDFYFIQKIAQRGRFNSCTGTRVVPSSRTSDRVPFGTGPALRAQLHTPLRSYHSAPFAMLNPLFSDRERLYKGNPLPSLSPILSDFLVLQGFDAALARMRANAASAEAFSGRFWRWFNMFRIMKFLHFARERGYPDQAVEEVAVERLLKMGAGGLKAAGAGGLKAGGAEGRTAGGPGGLTAGGVGGPKTGGAGGLKAAGTGTLPSACTELLSIYRHLDRLPVPPPGTHPHPLFS